MQGAWSFLILIIMNSYTGALSAYLTTEGMKTSIKSAEDLAAQVEIDYGTQRKWRGKKSPRYHGQYRTFFPQACTEREQQETSFGFVLLLGSYRRCNEMCDTFLQESNVPYLKKMFQRMEKVRIT